MKRRQFIQSAILGSTTLVLPIGLNAINGKNRKLRFGVCADVHKDVMHDADERLQEFIDEAEEKQLDFIIQMGDFCRPYEYNREFLSIWDSYSKDSYHVIGNHETDGGFTRKQVIDFWNISEQYYSFDENGYHIIVLDGNDKNPSENKASGYARFIGNKQFTWLIQDLKNTNLPCLVFSHQSLEKNDDGIENRAEIRELFEQENQKAGFSKIIACFSGHHHTDHVTEINEIFYIQINSMSYEWLGDKYLINRYTKEIDEKFPYIKYTAPYKDPLYAFVEIVPGKIKIEGVKSIFVGPSPKELNYPERPVNNPSIPAIKNRNIITSAK